MRLFLAINFDEEIKDALSGIIDRLRREGAKGNFSLRENLHLTLIFIGETNRVDDVFAALNEGVKRWSVPAFPLRISGLGTFRRDEGEILWAGIKAGRGLYELQEKLKECLADRGFQMENRKYKPHLTLGRKVILPAGFDQASFALTLPEMEQRVRTVSLMKSERINGKLTYTEIYKKDLEI